MIDPRLDTAIHLEAYLQKTWDNLERLRGNLQKQRDRWLTISFCLFLVAVMSTGIRLMPEYCGTGMANRWLVLIWSVTIGCSLATYATSQYLTTYVAPAVRATHYHLRNVRRANHKRSITT